MLDPDDVEAIALERSFEDLIACAQEFADPELVLVHWLDALVVTLLHQQMPGRPLSWVLLQVNRWTIQQMRAFL